MGIQRYSIIYSSKTGNTKKLAEKIREVLPEENCDYFGTEGAKALSSDILYIGFWTDIGNADPATLELLKSLKNQSVRDRYVKMKEKPNHAPNLDELIRNFDRALSHPDNEDLDRLEEIIRRDLEK